VIQGEIDVQRPVAKGMAKNLPTEFQRQRLEETVVCCYSLRCGYGDFGPLVAAGDWEGRTVNVMVISL
jgi:hypothetical protein